MPIFLPIPKVSCPKEGVLDQGSKSTNLDGVEEQVKTERIVRSTLCRQMTYLTLRPFSSMTFRRSNPGGNDEGQNLRLLPVQKKVATNEKKDKSW